MKDYYFFFKDGMPIAVFMTNFKWESVKLFLRLYKHKSWRDAMEMGITIAKEDDVPYETWQRIHDEYKGIADAKRRGQEKKNAIELKAAQSRLVLPKSRPVEQGSTMLETAKYLR